MRKPIIYFAGKIAKDDWRSEILRHRPGGVFYFKDLLDPEAAEEYPTFIYGGPFFIACDHGCAHGPATHGARPSPCTHATNDLADKLELHGKIWCVNNERIRRADFVFAYINETNCFGTLVELGYAAALDKAIGIGIGRNIKIEQYDDLWMPRICHSMLTGEWLGTPQETFTAFLTCAAVHWQAVTGAEIFLQGLTD